MLSTEIPVLLGVGNIYFSYVLDIMKMFFFFNFVQGTDLYAAPLNIPLDQVLYTVVYVCWTEWVHSFMK